jgi:hypothetical protein
MSEFNPSNRVTLRGIITQCYGDGSYHVQLADGQGILTNERNLALVTPPAMPAGIEFKTEAAPVAATTTEPAEAAKPKERKPAKPAKPRAPRKPAAPKAKPAKTPPAK